MNEVHHLATQGSEEDEDEDPDRIVFNPLPHVGLLSEVVLQILL